MDALKQIGKLMQETVKEWNEDGAASIAAALAYYAIFSLSPLLIIIALLIGLVLGKDTASDDLMNDVEVAIGAEGANTFRDMMDNANQNQGSSVVGSIVWISVIIWGASGLFAQLQAALNRIWEVKGMPGRSPLVLIKNRLLSFGVVLGASAALLITLILNTIINNLMLNLEVGSLTGLIVRPLQIIVTMSMFTFLIAAIFKILPDIIISWKDVLVGAAFTAFLFMIGQFAVGFYLANTDVGSVFGAAGSLTVILVWIYYSAQILLFGAEFTEVWARHHGAYIRPDEDAVWINEAQARREAEAAGIVFES